MSADGYPYQARDHVSEVKRVTWTGLAANLVLSAAKLAGGVMGNSQAIVADAFHSLSDTSTDAAILIGVRYWARPPDGRHPHGHRRIETLVSGGIGLLLGVVAVGIALRAALTLTRHHPSPPGWIAAGAALLSIVCKEALYRWTVRVGERAESPAVVANAWHHRSDAFSSVPVLVAVLTARLHPDWFWLDHLGAVVVSVFVFRAAVQVVWPALEELVEAGAPRRELERIRRLALEIDGVQDVHAIRSRRVGGKLHADLHVLVEGEMTVSRGHEIAEEVKRRLVEQGPHIADAVVHIEPYEDADATRLAAEPSSEKAADGE